LGFAEDCVEQPQNAECEAERRSDRKRRADPNSGCRLETTKNNTETAKRRDKARQHQRTEEGNSRYATVIKPSFRVASRADIGMAIMPAKEVAENRPLAEITPGSP